MKQTICKFCKSHIVKTRKNKLFCSDKCRKDYWTTTHPTINLNKLNENEKLFFEKFKC